MVPIPVARRVMTPANDRASFRLHVKIGILRCASAALAHQVSGGSPRRTIASFMVRTQARASGSHGTPGVGHVYCGRVTLVADGMAERAFDQGGATLADVGEPALLRALSEI